MFNKKENKIPESKKQEIFVRIKPIIAKELEIDEGKLMLRSSFTEDLGADSLDSIQLIMALEEVFNIEISDSDAERMKIVDDVVTYLGERVV